MAGSPGNLPSPVVPPASRLRVLPVSIICALAAGCASSEPVRIVSLPAPQLRPVARVDTISDYGVAAVTIVWVIERDLAVPRFPVAFHFCRDRHAFEAALLDSGYPRALARDTAERMHGVGGYRRVLFNEAAFAAQPWPARVASMAHEIGHSLQYEWGGGRRGVSDQWLREGFAEWLSLRVMDRLGGTAYGRARREYLFALRRTTRSHAPQLDDMATFPQWVGLGGRRDIAPYAQSFLAVDFLMQRHGLEAVMDYFKRFAQAQDRTGNFRAAFGEDLASFERALEEHLWSTAR